jgi:hypothetical protein
VFDKGFSVDPEPDRFSPPSFLPDSKALEFGVIPFANPPANREWEAI